MTRGRLRTPVLALAIAGVVASPAHAQTIDLHGRLHVPSLLIRSSTTIIATSTLTILASGSVTVDGAIELAPGAGLTIDAQGPILMKGPVKPEPRRRHHAAREARGPTCSNPPIIERSEHFGITIDRGIVAGSGTTDAAGDGCRGQSIILTAKSGGITLNSIVRAGDGGSGRDNAEERAGRPGGCHAPGQFMYVRSGNGGDGGDVTLNGHPGVTGGEVLGARFVRAGNGGIGGSVTAYAPSGGANQSGTPLHVFAGRGGDGGNARLNYGDSHPMFGHGGDGGFAGDVTAASGNGGPTSCDGGELFVSVGRKGDNGEGSFETHFRAREAKVQASGGNADQTPPKSGDGGKGGDLTITGGGLARGGYGAFVQSLHVGGFDGGPGANLCTPAPPHKGGNGGANGSFRIGLGRAGDGKIKVASTPRDVVYAFNGGHGGDGSPIGKGWHPARPLAASGLDVIHSWEPGPDGNPCKNTGVQVGFNGAAPGVKSWIPGALSVDPSDPMQAYALGKNAGGNTVLVDWNLQTHTLGPAGTVTLPAPPSGNGYTGLTRLGANDTLVYATLGTDDIGWWRLNDAGTSLGSGTIVTGGSAFSGVAPVNLSTPSGQIVVWFGVDPVMHVADTGSFSVSASSVVAGPLPKTNFTGKFIPSSVARIGSRLGFTGLINITDFGTYFIDLAGTNPSGPFSLGQNAGQTLPAIGADSKSHWFVLSGLPAPGNDQQLGMYSVLGTGGQTPGFSPWLGPHAVQAFPAAVFFDGGKVTAFGNDGGTPVVGYFNPTTGAPDPTVQPFPFPLLASGSMYAYIQSASAYQSGYLLLTNNDTGAGVIELSG